MSCSTEGAEETQGPKKSLAFSLVLVASPEDSGLALEFFLLSVHQTLSHRSRSGEASALTPISKRCSTSSKKMPHVTEFVHTMSKQRKGNKAKKKQTRDRSDLSIGEFGTNS